MQPKCLVSRSGMSLQQPAGVAQDDEAENATAVAAMANELRQLVDTANAPFRCYAFATEWK
jgi:hypothetical protein